MHNGGMHLPNDRVTSKIKWQFLSASSSLKPLPMFAIVIICMANRRLYISQFLLPRSYHKLTYVKVINIWIRTCFYLFMTKITNIKATNFPNVDALDISFPVQVHFFCWLFSINLNLCFWVIVSMNHCNHIYSF